MKICLKYNLMIIILFILIFSIFSNAYAISDKKTPIQHVIIIIQENHSFDNLFGTYPFGWPPIVNNITISLPRPDGLYENYSQLLKSNKGILDYISIPNIPWLPFVGYSHPYYANSSSTEDPIEGWSVYHGDYWFGSPIGFVYYSGKQSLAYFSYEQVGLLWDYAEEYVLADNYFVPVLGLTEPNRIAYLIGEPPGFYTNDKVNIVPVEQSIFYQLNEFGISWKYYVYKYKGGIPWPLNAFIAINNKEYISKFYSLDEFYGDLETNLPSVSWVMFLGAERNNLLDMHPPFNLTLGSIALVNLINRIMKSPFWNSTVIFLTFDEGGGYYDHITPPSIDNFGLGQRVPLLVISPYSKEAWINNELISGYTLLAFIEYNWNLPWLTEWVENSNLQGLLKSFDFNQEPRNPLILIPDNWTYPIKLQYPIHYDYIAKINQNWQNYAQRYSYLGLNVSLLLNIFSIAMLIASIFIRKRRNVSLSLSISLISISLGISIYYYLFILVYSYISNYFLLYSSIILVFAILLRIMLKFK